MDIINLVNCKALSDFIGHYCKFLTKQIEQRLPITEEKLTIESLIETIIEIVLDFKDREMYDALSMRFIRAEAFLPLIKVIVSGDVAESEYRAVARIFELCACH